MIILALILLSLSPPASSMVELQDKQELPVHNEKEGMEYLQTVNNFTDWTNAELNSRHR